MQVKDWLEKITVITVIVFLIVTFFPWVAVYRLYAIYHAPTLAFFVGLATLIVQVAIAFLLYSAVSKDEFL